MPDAVGAQRLDLPRASAALLRHPAQRVRFAAGDRLAGRLDRLAADTAGNGAGARLP